MTGDDLATWVEAKLRGVPEELADEIRLLVLQDGPAAGRSRVAEALANAALRGLDGVVAREGDRGTALRLLAADAALTYAFQAAAELGEDVSALAERVGLGGELVQQVAHFAVGQGVLAVDRDGWTTHRSESAQAVQAGEGFVVKQHQAPTH